MIARLSEPWVWHTALVIICLGMIALAVWIAGAVGAVTSCPRCRGEGHE